MGRNAFPAGRVASAGQKNSTVKLSPAWRRHRNVALGSMGIATIGASMMWFFDH